MATPQRKLQSHDIPSPAANDDRRPTPRVVVDNTKTQGQVQSTDEAWRREQASRTAAGQLTREEEQTGARPLPPFEERHARPKKGRGARPSSNAVITPGKTQALRQVRARGRETQPEENTLSRRVDPNSVSVTRKGTPYAGDSRYQTIDQTQEAAQDSRTTRSRLRNPEDEKEKKTLRTRVQVGADEWRRKQRVQRFARQRKRLTRIRTEEGTTKGIAKKAKLIRATWMASAAAFGLYAYQLGFWIIAIIGLGVEADLDAGLFAAIIQWTVSFIIPGQELFVAGWLISSVLALWGMALAFGAYLINGVNPFRGNGMIAFGIVFALTLLPLALIPWVYVWIFIVFREHTAQKKTSRH